MAGMTQKEIEKKYIVDNLFKWTICAWFHFVNTEFPNIFFYKCLFGGIEALG